MDTLNAKYPGFLENIDKETVSNETLRDRLIEVNDEYTKKILIAGKQKAIADAEERAIEAIGKEAQFRAQINEQIIKYTEALGVAYDATQPLDIGLPKLKKDLEEARKANNNFFEEIALGQASVAVKPGANLFNAIFGDGFAKTSFKEEEKLQQTFDAILSQQREYDAATQEISATTAAYVELLKDMGMTQEEAEAFITGSTKATKANTAATKENTDATKDATKAAEELAKAREAINKQLAELNTQLTDLIVANAEEGTAKLLSEEEIRYQRAVQLAEKNTQDIIANENSTAEQIAEARSLQKSILEQIEIQHQQNIDKIKKDDLEKENARLKAEEDARISSNERILRFQQEAVAAELEIAEKGSEEKKKLLDKQLEYAIRALEQETLAQLRAATSEQERTAIVAAQVAKRKAILEKFAEERKKIDEEGKDTRGMLAKMLGVTDEEAKAIVGAVQQVISQTVALLDSMYEAQIARLDKSIERSQQRLDKATEAFQRQREMLATMEDRLDTATGSKRANLIALIEQEREQEELLAKEKAKEAAKLAAIEKEKERIQRKQANLQKGIAVAETIQNTAVSIVKANKDLPFPFSLVISALYAGIGLASLAKIASTPEFADGGKLDGPSHKDGGVPIVIGGRKAAEAEGGEWIVNKQASQTNDEALRTINTHGRYVKYDLVPRYEDGGIIQPDFAGIQQGIAAASTQGGGLSQAEQREQTQLLRALLEKSPVVGLAETAAGLERVRLIQSSTQVG
jgi:hypothetical protein